LFEECPRRSALTPPNLEDPAKDTLTRRKAFGRGDNLAKRFRIAVTGKSDR
jgi:hypothetical protein